MKECKKQAGKMDWYVKVERPSSVSCPGEPVRVVSHLGPRPLLYLSNSCKILKYQSLKDKDSLGNSTKCSKMNPLNLNRNKF